MVSQELFRRASVAALVMVALGAVGCGEKIEADDRAPAGSATAAAAPATPVGESAAASAASELTPETQQAIDAGNAAVRAKDYERALVAFEKAAALSPELPAPWFGIYIVAQARKDSKAADAALAEIRKRGAAPAVTGGQAGAGVMKN